MPKQEFNIFTKSLFSFRINYSILFTGEKSSFNEKKRNNDFFWFNFEYDH